MRLKVFSKRHPEIKDDIRLRRNVRQRIWYLLEDSDPFALDLIEWSMCTDDLPDRLKKEHGWNELRAYSSLDQWEEANIKDFILRGVPRFVIDATEIFYDLLIEDQKRRNRSRADPSEYQRRLNTIFEDADLPWRMLDGRIVRLDSKWVEAEIAAKARELLDTHGFDGALAEFQQARSNLSSGDTKGAIHAANLALESTIKTILNIDREKPGALIRKLIDSGVVPDYHHGFLKAFEEHILRSVPNARNLERGVGHGQGSEPNDPPKSLAELAVNLAGVLILFLMKRHAERSSQRMTEEGSPEAGSEDEIPF